MFSNSIDSSRLKKIDRKLRKLQHVVFKETGVICSFEPKKGNYIKINLVICNAGLVNGLSEEIVFEYFSKYGTLDTLLLLPGKSCCFVTYKDLDSAQEAFNNYNGKLNIAQDMKPIYILFTDKLPDISHFTKVWGELPLGLVIIEDFVTVDEENQLLKLCNFSENVSLSEQRMKHRQVKHYGYEFRYDINNVDKDNPLEEKIPKQCQFVFDKLNNTPFNNFQPDQLTVNHYKPGQGIPSHVDTHSAFEDPILSLSLQSSIVMEFKKQDKQICVLLPQRSLAIMSGESRYDWSHGIPPRKFDIVHSKTGFATLERGTRVSFTFRKILSGKCTCSYKTLCDTYNNPTNEPVIKNSSAHELEKLHVHNVYENIASHFSDTRHKPWPNVLEFVKSFSIGSILVDIGCGNGKYLGQNKNIFDMGCDTSFGLLQVCIVKGLETFAGNCLNLPLKDDISDGAISIAVIHHLATEERRLQAIKEIMRILKPGGKALIYVWAKDQLRHKQMSSYIKQDKKNRKTEESVTVRDELFEKVSVSNDVSLPVHINRTQFKHKDVLVPWKLKNNSKLEGTFLRYYHVFEENELENLCCKLSDVEIVKSYYDQGNWCIIIRKKIKIYF